MDANPLKQYFRQPAIFVRLPSQGRFWPKDTVDMPANGELPVLPMTTMDEITYRTPDALFNGQAVISVIQSCIPNIKDAWFTPSTDIDTILIAIRIATYGHEMDITTQCPACETEGDYGIDLRMTMEQITTPDYSKPLKTGDLELWFRPMTYRDINANGLAQFEDQKMMQSLQTADISEEERMRTLGDILRKLTGLTAQALSQNIAMIRTPNAQVTEANHIQEWLMNCDKVMFNQVKDHVVDLRRMSEIKPVHVKCGNCGHEHDQPFTLDMTTFFEDAS
jgi:hypothetical protein